MLYMLPAEKINVKKSAKNYNSSLSKQAHRLCAQKWQKFYNDEHEAKKST